MSSGSGAAVQVWHYGGEVWLQPSDGCQECAKRWRQHDWSTIWTNASAAAVSHLVEAQRPFVAELGSRFARRIDTKSNEVSDHFFVAHPDCPKHGCASEVADAIAAGGLPRDSSVSGLRVRSLREMGGRLMDLVDSHLGQIRRIDDFRTHEPMSGASAQLRPNAGPGTNEHGYGRSGHTRADRLVALIEALERRAGMRPGGDVEVVTGSRARLGHVAIDPRLFILPESLPADPSYAKYSPDTEYEWVWGWSARRDDRLLVPKQMVYFGDRAPLGGRFAYEISNGCAAGGSLSEATLFGLLEVIERDAFLTSWHSGRQVRLIDPAILDEWSRGVVSRFAAEGVETRVLDIGCGLPGTTVAVEMLSRNSGYLPAVAYAASSSPDPAAAARGALQEVAAMLRRVDAEERERRRSLGDAMLEEPSLVRTMHDHGSQGDADLAERRIRFNLSEQDPIRPAEAPPWAAGLDSTLQVYIGAVLSLGLDVIVCNQSYSPTRERGLNCVKVLVPGLHSMTFGHGNSRLSHARLALFAPRSSWRMAPHPFP